MTMHSWIRGVVIGIAAGCASTGGGAVPRVGDACDDGEPARCGMPEGSSDSKNVVLVCDGDTWSSALVCVDMQQCSDDEDRGAVLCSHSAGANVFGEHNGSCDVDGAQACSFDGDFILECEGGTWTIATNCSTGVQNCALVESGDDPTCTDGDGCLVCA